MNRRVQFGSKMFCPTRGRKNFTEGRDKCSRAGYTLASISTFVDYVDTMRAIDQIFLNWASWTYLSLQNPNKKECHSDQTNDCNGYLQDAYGNVLQDLKHVADLKIKDIRQRTCIRYDIKENEFEPILCSNNNHILCQRIKGPPDCGQNQAYYKFDVKSSFWEAKRNCEEVGLRLITPNSKHDLEVIQSTIGGEFE
ncbi:uncharacterized protein LOC131885110 [Tigriopus californicus]|uniref:uncharacterized protein LOC131885110 n=1 Tax=Tigriopus californicus TaxID=6832 RepID=UPI0027DA3961|nr:uncharacterized protein LOC131885110 [Tigriopus californicus]